MNVLLLFEALLKNIICFLFQTDQPGVKNIAPRGMAFMSNLINCRFSEVFSHTHDPCLNGHAYLGTCWETSNVWWSGQLSNEAVTINVGESPAAKQLSCSDQPHPQC